MSCDNIQIIQSSENINIIQSSDGINIIQSIQEINMCADSPIFNNFIPFFFTATQGQTVFNLPSIALATWCNINGTAQSQSKIPTPDFTVSGNILTLSEGLDAGDIVFGMIQVL